MLSLSNRLSWNWFWIIGCAFIVGTVSVTPFISMAIYALVTLFVAILLRPKISLIGFVAWTVLVQPLLQNLLNASALTISTIPRLVNSSDTYLLLILALGILVHELKDRNLGSFFWWREFKYLRWIPIFWITLSLSWIISSLINGVPVTIGTESFVLANKGFLFLFLCLGIMKQRILEGQRILILVLRIGLLSLVLGVVQFVSPNTAEIFHINLSPDRFGIPAMVSYFGNPGHFGWFMTVNFAVAASIYVIKGKRRYICLSIVFELGSELSLRRLAIAGIFLVVLIIWMYTRHGERHEKRRAMTAVLISNLPTLVIGASTIYKLFQNAISQYVTGQSSMQTARDALYITGWKIGLAKFPFGMGLGQFGDIESVLHYSKVYFMYGLNTVWGLSPQYPWFVMDTFWPHVLGEAGFAGAVSYLLFLLFYLCGLKEHTSRVDRNGDRLFLLIGLSVFCETLLESIAAPIYEDSTQIYLIMLLIAMPFFRIINPKQLP